MCIVRSMVRVDQLLGKGDYCMSKKIGIGCLICSSIAVLSGCAIGPTSLRYSSVQYNNSMLRSSSQQLLLNIIRYQYGEAPFFLESSSVSASFQYDANAQFTPSIVPGSPANFGFGTELAYSERPQITYVPLRGQKFIDQLLHPINGESLYYLLRNTRIDIAMMTVVQNIGKLRNTLEEESVFYTRKLDPRMDKLSSFEKFRTLVQGWQQLNARGCLDISRFTGERKDDGGSGNDNKPKLVTIGIRVKAKFPKENIDIKEKGKDSKNREELIFPDSRSYKTIVDDFLGTNIGPDTKADEKEISYTMELVSDDLPKESLVVPTPKESQAASTPKESSEASNRIAIHLRSLHHCLAFVAQGIDVPPDDIEKVLVERYNPLPDKIEDAIRNISVDTDKKPEDVKKNLQEFNERLGTIKKSPPAIETTLQDIENDLALIESYPEEERMALEETRSGLEKVKGELEETYIAPEKLESDLKGIGGDLAKTGRDFGTIKTDLDAVNADLRIINTRPRQNRIALEKIKSKLEICRNKLNQASLQTKRNYLKGLMQIERANITPRNAFVSAKYLGNEFYIKDTDTESKVTFMILSLLYELQAGELKPFGPTWSIDVGSK